MIYCLIIGMGAQCLLNVALLRIIFRIDRGLLLTASTTITLTEIAEKHHMQIDYLAQKTGIKS